MPISDRLIWMWIWMIHIIVSFGAPQKNLSGTCFVHYPRMNVPNAYTLNLH